MSSSSPAPYVVFAGLLVLAGLTGGWTRPLGDFGRAAPSVVHDDLMPAIGDLRSRLAGEPVSSFNLTDEENDLADRVWRFETSGHARDWEFDLNAELQRTRLTAPPGQHFAVDRYYEWLSRTPYRSAQVRYTTLADDVAADIATIPDTFAVACKVEAIDRQRQAAASGLPALEPAMRQDLVARLAENDRQIDLFVDAVQYRYDSYNYALDHLLVETPYPAARGVDDQLIGLKLLLDRATHWDFCAAAAPARHAAPASAEIPSRYGRPAAGPTVAIDWSRKGS